MIGNDLRFFPEIKKHRKLEIGVSLIVGLLLGLMVVFTPFLPLPSDLQKLIFVVPIAIIVVILFNDLEKLILFAIAISIPLNLDFSVIISPYGRNAINNANGLTIVALTELRLSLILIIVGIGYVLWLIEHTRGNHESVHFFGSTSIPALGLIFVSMISMFQSQDLQLSFFKIAQLVELFLVYFYLANHLRTKQELQFFIIVVLGAMLAESILMILQWFTGWEFSIAGIAADVEKATRRAAGTLNTPDTAGSIISSTLAIACVMIWLFPKNKKRIFSEICFVLGIIAMITTASRAAWVSFLVVIISIVFLAWQRGWVRGKSVLILILLMLIIGSIFAPSIINRLTADDRGSAASRPMMFRLAWNVIQSSPSHFFFGVGANNYALLAHNFNTSDIGNLGYIIYSSVHNAYLLTWAETGLIGLLLFLGFLVAPLLKAWTFIKSDDRFISLMALGIGFGLFALCIQMLVDPFISRPKTILIWLLISLIACLRNFEKEQVIPNPVRINT